MTSVNKLFCAFTLGTLMHHDKEKVKFSKELLFAFVNVLLVFWIHGQCSTISQV